MATQPNTPDLFETARSLGVSISPATPTIGAEISGLDLDRPLSSAEWDLLRAAWLRYKVIFFRDQDISHESHVRLGEYFGELEGHPVIPHVEGYPEILRIEGVEGVQLTAETLGPFQAYNKWHTDVTFRERPSIASILRARVLPPLGGDTMWADTAAAYAGLPQAVKDRIEGLEAEHDIVLPEAYRDVYVLADVEGMSNPEIASLLDMSIPAVKSRLHRGRLMMRETLAPHFEEAAP